MVDRHNDPQYVASRRIAGVDRTISMGIANLAQNFRVRHIGNETGFFAAGKGNDPSSPADERDFFHATLFAQLIDYGYFVPARHIGELPAHIRRFRLQFAKQPLESRAAKIQAALQTLLDFDVEPGFDAFRQKLHR